MTLRTHGAIYVLMQPGRNPCIHDETIAPSTVARLIVRIAVLSVVAGVLVVGANQRGACATLRLDPGDRIVNGAKDPVAHGRVSEPGTGAILFAGQSVDVRWSPPPAGTRELELLMVADGITLRLTAQLEPDATSYRWTVPDIPASRVFLQVRFNRGRGEEIAASGAPFHIVDLTLAPRALARRFGGELWLESGHAPGTALLTRSLERVARVDVPAGFVLALAPEHNREGEPRERTARPSTTRLGLTNGHGAIPTVALEAALPTVCQRE